MKRYEALYVGGILDGYFDNKTGQYLDDDTLVSLLNKEDYDSIWEKRYEKVAKQGDEMRHQIWKCNRDKKKQKDKKISSKSIYRFR